MVKSAKKQRTKKGLKDPVYRELVFKEDMQEYALVSRMLGDCRVRIMCFDDIERLGIIRGKIRDMVSITQTSYQTNSYLQLTD